MARPDEARAAGEQCERQEPCLTLRTTLAAPWPHPGTAPPLAQGHARGKPGQAAGCGAQEQAWLLRGPSHGPATAQLRESRATSEAGREGCGDAVSRRGWPDIFNPKRNEGQGEVGRGGAEWGVLLE